MQSVVTGGIILLLIAFAVYRRMQAQPVQPQRAVILSAIVVALSAFSLVAANRLTAHPLALVLALPALAVGLGGGLLLMRSIRFWRDEATGALWMKGGVVYLAAWLGTVLLRQIVAYASGAYTTAGSLSPGQHAVNPALAVLSTDLIIVSMGLWIARAAALVRTYRAYERTDRSALR